MTTTVFHQIIFNFFFFYLFEMDFGCARTEHTPTKATLSNSITFHSCIWHIKKFVEQTSNSKWRTEWVRERDKKRWQIIFILYAPFAILLAAFRIVSGEQTNATHQEIFPQKVVSFAFIDQFILLQCIERGSSSRAATTTLHTQSAQNV